MEQGTKQWHEFRMGKIGSSDAPVILGVSPYKTAYDLWLEKKERKKQVEIDQFIAEKGHLYEDLARLDLERETKLYWKPMVFVHEENERLFTSVDGFNEEELLFWECKYMGKDKFSTFSNNFLSMRERVSEQYYPQVIHHAYVTGGSKFFFSGVVDHQVFKSIPKGEQRFHHCHFELGEEDFAYIKDVYEPKIKEFLETLDGEQYPFIESSDFISIEDDKLEELVHRYKEINTQYSLYSSELDKVKEEIFAAAFQYNDKVLINGAKITISESKPKEFMDYELLIKENPSIIQGVEVDNYKRHKNSRKTRRITLQKDS